MIPIQAQIKKKVRTTVMKRMVSTFVIPLRLWKDNVVLIIREKSREAKAAMSIQTLMMRL